MEQETDKENHSRLNEGEKGFGPIASLKRVLSLLRENPFVFVIAILYGIIQLNLAALSIIITPFLAGGLYSFLIKSHDEKNLLLEDWIPVFIDGGKKKYIRLLVGSLVYFVLFLIPISINLLLSVLGQIGVYAIGTIAAGLGPDNPLAFAAFPLIPIVALITISIGIVLLLIFEMFIQFYDIGIVALDYSVEDSFKESVNFVKKQFKSVLGFTLVKLAVFVLLSFIPLFIQIYNNSTSVFNKPQFYEISTPVIILFTVSLILYTAFSFTYKTTFYIFNVVDAGEPESNRLILLKIFGIALYVFIFLSVISLLFAY